MLERVTQNHYPLILRYKFMRDPCVGADAIGMSLGDFDPFVVRWRPPLRLINFHKAKVNTIGNADPFS